MIKGKVAAVLIGLSATMFGSISTAAAQGKELVVATDTAFVPFEFKQGSTYTGFDIDLWAAIAKELNLKYKLQPMDFNGIIPGLQTKNIDVALAGITIRDDRKKVIDFSDPLLRKRAGHSGLRQEQRHQGRQGPLRQNGGRQDRHRDGGLPQGPGARGQAQALPQYR